MIKPVELPDTIAIFPLGGALLLPRARLPEGFERDLGREEVDAGFGRPAFLDLLGRYFDTQGLSADWDTLKEADDELLINSLSMMLELDPEDKQALLEAPSLETRRETLVTLIEYTMRGGQDEGLMQ